jgi:hypothetical protein
MLHTFSLKMAHLSFLLLLLFFVPGSGITGDVNGVYEMYGTGSQSCGSFARERKKEAYARYAAWMAGYLTAVDARTPTASILGTTDLQGAMLWLENYCNKNPLEPFANAVYALVDARYPMRFTPAPK